MDIAAQRLCAWSGLLFLMSFGVGWFFVAQFLPPHSPSATASEIAAIYQQNTVRIRAGLALSLAGSGFIMPFCALISTQMRRIQGAGSVLANTQLVCSSVLILVFTIPMMIWESIAFRPDRSPDIMLAMNDVGWMIFTMTLSPFLVQFLSIAIAVLQDRSPEPVFPRWMGFLTLWIALLVLPAGVIAFFHTGPFAWDGLLAFWLPVSVFAIWIVVMFFVLRRAIDRQENGEHEMGA